MHITFYSEREKLVYILLLRVIYSPCYSAVAVVGFEQTTYTFREDAGTVDVCTAFLQPAEIDQDVFVDLLGSTTDGSADGENNYIVICRLEEVVGIQSEWIFNNVMVHTYVGMKHWYTNKPPYTSYTIPPLTLTQ